MKSPDLMWPTRAPRVCGSGVRRLRGGEQRSGQRERAGMGTLRAACCVAVIAVLSVAALAPEAHSAPCPAADGPATAHSVTELRATLLCLHNRARGRYGLGPLGAAPALQRAAQRHAAHMVSAGFMAHTTPAGTTLLERIRRVGYIEPGEGFLLGENLGYGSGEVAAPAAMFRMWMRSPEHRAEILAAEFRDVGIGAARGTPTGAEGRTYTIEFGVRR
jgi:uncharacterized protein YkwD